MNISSHSLSESLKQNLSQIMVNQELYLQFLEHLIRGEKNECFRIVKKLLADGITIVDLYEKLFKESLYSVGLLWEENKVSVATEHLATAITENILNWLYAQVIAESKIGKTAVLSCIEHEYHQIGIKMVNDIFERNGWNTFYLGANTPTSSIISLAKSVSPDILGISVSLYQNIPAAINVIKSFNAEFPGKKIIIGGQAFNHGVRLLENKFENVVIIKNLYNLDMLLTNQEVLT